MTFSYNPGTLANNVDKVRLLIYDVDVDNVRLHDEEINMVLTEETALGARTDALIYFAAARCLELLQTRWLQVGEGVLEKEVDELRVRYTALESGSEALARKISELRSRGAQLNLRNPHVLKVL
jgi:hypothetical protein